MLWIERQVITSYTCELSENLPSAVGDRKRLTGQNPLSFTNATGGSAETLGELCPQSVTLPFLGSVSGPRPCREVNTEISG